MTKEAIATAACAPAGWELPGDAQFWFNALVADPAVHVKIVDRDGVVHFACPTAQQAFGGGASLVGRKLSDLLPAGLAEERLAHVRRAIDDGETLVVDGAVQGVAMRTFVRPMPSCGSPRREGAQSKCAVIISRPLTERDRAVPTSALTGATVVESQRQDMGALSRLTRKERDVLVLIGKGWTTARIADHLGRTSKTIEYHRTSLGAKLGVRSRIELARIAARAGLDAAPMPRAWNASGRTRGPGRRAKA